MQEKVTHLPQHFQRIQIDTAFLEIDPRRFADIFDDLGIHVGLREGVSNILLCVEGLTIVNSNHSCDPAFVRPCYSNLPLNSWTSCVGFARNLERRVSALMTLCTPMIDLWACAGGTEVMVGGGRWKLRRSKACAMYLLLLLEIKPLSDDTRAMTTCI